MNAETFCEHFATFAEPPGGVAKLRELILQLAVQGKLVPQDEHDEPASALRAKILAKRKQLVATGAVTAFATDTQWPDGALPYSLPGGWEWIRLGDLGGILGGGTPSKERAEFWDGTTPWVSPKDMKRPYIDDAIDHVSVLGVEASSGKMIPKGSLLMVVRGMILAHSFPVALAMRALTINQDMKAMQLALPELGEYMLRCCAACKSRMLVGVERSSHGTCRLPTETVANFPIPLPPLAEQRRIVAKVDQLLGLCDELAARQEARRTARERLVVATLADLTSPRDTTDRTTPAQRLQTHFDTLFDTPTTIPHLRQTILQLAVQGKLVPQDPNDSPASRLHESILSKRQQLVSNGEITAFPTDTEWAESELPYSLPKGWEWIRLGELGGFLGGGTPSKERSEFWDGTIPWVSPKDMKRPYIDDAIDHVSALGVENSSGKMIPKGSLLMVVRGMILAHSFPVALAMRELTINQDMKAMRLALPELGEYMLRCFAAIKPRMLAGVERSSHGTCRLPTEVVANFPIPLPPLAEQKRIVAKVTALLAWCDTLERQLQATETASTQLLAAAVQQLLSATHHQPV